MRALALQPSQLRPPVTGLIVHAAHQQNLRAKLVARASHYGDVFLAIGPDWTALFCPAESAAPDLPWSGDTTTYLYPWSTGCLCELGHAPNVPAPLASALSAKLRQTYGATGTIALVRGGDTPGLYDLSAARKIRDVDLAALA
ncbi:MAG: hypothetical protein AB8B51_12205 [Sedimentitalea sp.]